MKIEIEGAVILKDGEQIGTIEGDNAAMIAATPPAIKGKINEVAGRRLTFTGGESAPKSDAVETPAETPAEAKKVPDPKNPYNVPAGQDPRFGSKTPGWKGGKA